MMMIMMLIDEDDSPQLTCQFVVLFPMQVQL